VGNESIRIQQFLIMRTDI